MTQIDKLLTPYDSLHYALQGRPTRADHLLINPDFQTWVLNTFCLVFEVLLRSSGVLRSTVVNFRSSLQLLVDYSLLGVLVVQYFRKRLNETSESQAFPVIVSFLSVIVRTLSTVI